MKQLFGIVMLMATASLQAQSDVDYSYYNEYLKATETRLHEHVASLSQEEVNELEGYLLDAQFNSRMSLLMAFQFVDDANRALKDE